MTDSSIDVIGSTFNRNGNALVVSEEETVSTFQTISSFIAEAILVNIDRNGRYC